MNIGESKQLMLDHIVESVVNGVAVPSAKNNDYLLLHNTLANTVQRRLAKIKKIHATYSITQNSIPNQLGDTDAFSIIQHLDTDNVQTQATGSRAYYFEVDNTATAYVEEYTGGAWAILSTISCSSPSGGFVAYKGLITPSSATNDVRIRFSGSYPYNIRNRALFVYTFASSSVVPNYTPYIEYTMPTNFYDKNKIMFYDQYGNYKMYTQHKWNGRNKLLIPYNEIGSFEVLYYKYPTVITSSSLDSVEFEVDVDVQDLIPLYVASKVIAEEKPQLSAILYNEFLQNISELSDINTSGSDEIDSVDGW